METELLERKQLNADDFLPEKEAIRYKKDRPNGCKTSFSDGFKHAMKLALDKSTLKK